MDPQSIWLTIADLKQQLYCPRVPFYRYVLPVPRRSTFKMQYGSRQHEAIEQLEKRRTLRRYDLDGGTRYFGEYLKSGSLRLTGKLDMLIALHSEGRCPSDSEPSLGAEAVQELIPVEFKFTFGRARANHKYQLAGYVLLLEDLYRTTLSRGLVYLVPQEKIVEFPMTPGVKDYTRKLLTRIRHAVAYQRFPPPVRSPRRCRDCEYLRYCADVEVEG